MMLFRCAKQGPRSYCWIGENQVDDGVGCCFVFCVGFFEPSVEFGSRLAEIGFLSKKRQRSGRLHVMRWQICIACTVLERMNVYNMY